MRNRWGLWWAAVMLIAGLLVAPAARAASAVVASQVIGYSAGGRAITAYELGDPHAAYKAVVLGSMHGYWEMAGEQVVRAIRGGSVAIPAGLDLWVVDTLNPDGDALHRRGNAHGVDLNRNWPNLWTYIAGSGDVFDSHYSGPAALSEPETRAMQSFLHQVKPNRLVSLHQPLDGVDSTDGGATDIAFRNALSANLGLPVKALTCNGGCHGSMAGWLTNYTSTKAITVEFPGPQSAAASPTSGSPSAGYLTGPAARGVLAAIMTGVRVPPAPAYPKLSAAAANSFVTKLYQRILGRNPDAGGLRAYSALLQAGTTSQALVATTFSTSTEHLHALVANAYQQCLGRGADSGGLNAYTAVLRTGSTWSSVLSALCGSGEAYARGGGNLSGWVDKLFAGLLGRPPANAHERAVWVNIAAHSGRPGTVTQVVGTTEYRARALNAVYLALLRRGVDSSGVATFSSAMPGRCVITVPIALSLSAEFARS